MANRYWVGGTAAWDGTAGTKWALTSGGAGGQAIPTATDDVFFTALSGASTVTISTGNTGALSITCTGFTGTLAGIGTITVAGSITFVAGMGYTHTGLITISGASTLTTAGKLLSGLTIAAAGSAVVGLGDNFQTSIATQIVTHTSGTFSTNNFGLAAGGFNSTTGTVRVVNFGSSIITLMGVTPITLSGVSATLTFNAGTSAITCANATPTFAGGGAVFNNVSFSSTTAGTRAVTGANTFNNFAVTAPAAVGVTQVTFDSRQTINGTLSITGTAGNRRVWFQGSTYGIAQTLTINSAPSLTDVDFRDIYVIGTAAPISGTRIGDLHGCRGITFDAPKTVYWNLAGAQNWSATGWATTSTGTPSTNNFPLAQDTATFTNAGSVTSTITMDAAVPYTGTVDMSSRTSAMTIATGVGNQIYGNWTNGSGTAFSGTTVVTFQSRTTQTITSAGKAWLAPITVNTYGGTVVLGDALNITAPQLLTIISGSFVTNNYAVTVDSITSNVAGLRSISLGTSVINFLNVAPIIFTTGDGLNLNASASTINLAATVTSFAGSGYVYNNVNIAAGTSTVQITDATFNNIVFGEGVQRNVRINSGIIINGSLGYVGTRITRLSITSINPGTIYSIIMNGVFTATNIDFQEIAVTGTVVPISGATLGDMGSNSGIVFTTKTVYWTLSGDQNWHAIGWATSSGGIPNVNNFPLAQDTAIIDNVVSNLSGIQFSVSSYALPTIDASTRTLPFYIQANATAYFYGDFKLGSGITIQPTGQFSFCKRTGIQTLTSAGNAFSTTVQILSYTGTLVLGDAFTSSAGLVITAGTFNAASFNVTVLRCASTGPVYMGSGLWTITGGATNPACWYIGGPIYKDTANILLSDTSTASRTFQGNGQSYNKLTIGGATGISTTTITGANIFTELASTKTVAHTIALGAAVMHTFSIWSITGTVGNIVTLTGTGSLNVNGARVIGVDYLAMGTTTLYTYANAEFYAGINSTGTGAGIILGTGPAPSPRFWVGGTGNWDATTTHWSTISGGSAGASAPTSVDDVAFDSLSNATAYTVTMTSAMVRCATLTLGAPASGNLTWAGSNSIALNSGFYVPVASRITRTYSGTISLAGATAGCIFNPNGLNFSNTVNTGNSSAMVWTLGSAWTNALTFQQYGGTFNTANYALSLSQLMQLGTVPSTISLGSSTVTLSNTNTPLSISSAQYYTLNAGTSTINLSGTSWNFNGNGLTYYNVSATDTGAGSGSITGSNTFNSFTIAGQVSGTYRTISIGADQIITNSFLITTQPSGSASGSSRTFLYSNLVGTSRTITCASAVFGYADFRDIAIAGQAIASGNIDGSSALWSDCGGNSGITFPVPKILTYTYGTSNSIGQVSAWTGGAFPLAQDTMKFVDNKPTTGLTVTISTANNLGTIDMSARTQPMTLTFTGSPNIHGNIIFNSVTPTLGTGTMNFTGRNKTQTITTGGAILTTPINVNALNTTVTLVDALTTTATAGIVITSGTFNANIYNVTTPLVQSSGSTTRTLSLGSALWTLSGATTPWSLSAIGLTLNKGSANISLSDNTTSARTFAGSGLSYPKLTIGGATGINATTITGNNTFDEIASTKTVASTLLLAATIQTVGAWTAAGTAGNLLTVSGTSAASPATLVLTGASPVNVDYLNISNVRVTPLSNKWYAGANSINNGSLGWIFATAVIVATAVSTFFLMF